MKTILTLILVSIVLLSCENTTVDDIFINSPEQRVREKIDRLRAKLLSNKEGWYAEYYYEDNKKPILLLFNFKDNKRVTIMSRFRAEDSGYILNYTEQVNLVFNTGSQLSDLVKGPDSAGKHQGGDFRWELSSMEQDVITFKSREGSFKLVLKKSDGSHLIRIAFISKLRPDPNKSFYRNLELEGVNNKYPFTFNEDDFTVTIKYKNALGEIIGHTSDLKILSDSKFELEKPFSVNEHEVKTFKYNDKDETFEVESSLVKGAIGYGSSPFSIDGAGDLFINNRKKGINPYQAIYYLKNPSKAFKPYLYTLLGIPKLEGVLWRIYDEKRVSRSSGYGKTPLNKWFYVGLNFNYELRGEDVLVIKSKGTYSSRYYSEDNKKEKMDIYHKHSEAYNKILLDEQGFNIIPNGENHFTLVAIADPKIYFVLELDN